MSADRLPPHHADPTADPAARPAADPTAHPIIRPAAAAPASSRQGAVFLDRDDTLVSNRHATAGTAHPGDLLDPGLLRLLPGVHEACQALALAGWRLVVFTNQAAAADGYCTLRQIEAVHDRLRALLPMLGPIYYSPCHAAGVVPRLARADGWRKPAGGMIRAACEELGIDALASWVVGDAARDIDAGIAGGVPADRCLRIAAPADPADLADLAALNPAKLDPVPPAPPAPASVSSSPSSSARIWPDLLAAARVILSAE